MQGSDLEDVMCKLLMKDNSRYVEILLGSGVNFAGVLKRTQELEASDDTLNFHQLQQSKVIFAIRGLHAVSKRAPFQNQSFLLSSVIYR